MDEKEDRVIFSGTTGDCLRHYGQTVSKLEKNCRRVLVPISEFTGADVDGTIVYWLSGRNLPAGTYLVKARYFLEGVGYGVAELEKLDPLIYDLGRFIAYDVLKLGEATELVKITQASNLLQVLHGKCGISAPRLGAIKEICETFCQELHGKVEEWRERFENERTRVSEYFCDQAEESVIQTTETAIPAEELQMIEVSPTEVSMTTAVIELSSVVTESQAPAMAITLEPEPDNGAVPQVLEETPDEMIYGEAPMPLTRFSVKTALSMEQIILQAFAEHVSASQEMAKKISAVGGKIGHQIILDELTRQIKAMAPLVEAVLSDEFSGEERSKLRSGISNGYGIFQLSCSLNRLCGERARREIKE